MITLEELKQCKDVTEELIESVKKCIDKICSNYDEHNNIEYGFGFKLNGTMYDVVEKDESSWDDQGKYQYQDITYQLVSFDENACSYPCNESIIDKFNLFIILPVTRSGSYFSEYYYSYSKPIIQMAVIEHVPEQVIPAHEEVKFI